MTVEAVPTLQVAELTVATGLVAGGRPALVAVNSLSLSWGRGTVLEQTTPARARVTVLDTSPGRVFACRRDLIGQVMRLGWSAPGSTGTNFRGRITDMTMDRYESPDGSRVGIAVTLDASSIEVDAANYLQQAAGALWPAESFTARLARIVSHLPVGLVTAAEVHPGWATYTAAQIDVFDVDLLSLLRRLFDSTARPLIYDPGADKFTYGLRRFIAAGAAGGDVLHSAMLALAGGKWAATCSPVGGSWLDARRFGYDGSIVADVASRLTRVQVGYLDVAAGYASATSEVQLATSPGEETTGRRALTVDTMHANAAGAADCAAEWASLALSEAALPRLEPVTFATARTPFADAAEVALLLAGVESSTWRFLRRSWLPEVGVPPLVGIIGGTIGYAAGQWTVQAQLAGAVNQNFPPGLMPAYAATDNTVRLVDLDDSLTVGDCAHVSIGAGYTAATMPFVT